LPHLWRPKKTGFRPPSDRSVDPGGDQFSLIKKKEKGGAANPRKDGFRRLKWPGGPILERVNRALPP